MDHQARASRLTTQLGTCFDLLNNQQLSSSPLQPTSHLTIMSKECLHTDFASQLDLTRLERQVLVQYQNLALKLYKLADEIKKIHQRRSEIDSQNHVTGQAHALLQNTRDLERKMGLVYTQFRTAVYALQLQNEELEGYSEIKTKQMSSGTRVGEGSPVRQLESEDEGTTVLSYEED